MIELLFVACMVSAPEQCDEHRLILGDVTPSACLQTAQAELARWLEPHPELRIDHWRCRALS